MEELMEGYVVAFCHLPWLCCSLLLTGLWFFSLPLCPNYNAFKIALEQGVSITEDVRVLLKILRGEPLEEDKSEGEGKDEEEKENYEDVEIADEAGSPSPPVNFKILVQNAIKEFGSAPCEVYNSVFQLVNTRIQHTRVVENLKCSDLQALVEAFSRDHKFSCTSHLVVVVYPVPAL